MRVPQWRVAPLLQQLTVQAAAEPGTAGQLSLPHIETELTPVSQVGGTRHWLTWPSVATRSPQVFAPLQHENVQAAAPLLTAGQLAVPHLETELVPGSQVTGVPASALLPAAPVPAALPALPPSALLPAAPPPSALLPAAPLVPAVLPAAPPLVPEPPVATAASPVAPAPEAPAPEKPPRPATPPPSGDFALGAEEDPQATPSNSPTHTAARASLFVMIDIPLVQFQ